MNSFFVGALGLALMGVVTALPPAAAAPAAAAGTGLAVVAGAGLAAAAGAAAASGAFATGAWTTGACSIDSGFTGVVMGANATLLETAVALGLFCAAASSGGGVFDSARDTGSFWNGESAVIPFAKGLSFAAGTSPFAEALAPLPGVACSGGSFSAEFLAGAVMAAGDSLTSSASLGTPLVDISLGTR